MSQQDWAKLYAAMDGRVTQKYDQLPDGEQIGRAATPRPPRNQPPKA